MSERKNTRAVSGLILLAVLCTVALGLQERRSVPLAAYSPLSPLGSGPRPLDRARGSQPWRALGEIGTRAFWLQPWPWILVGLVGFGLLAWGIAAWTARQGSRRMERD
jgi:hypothetical protein